MELYIIILLGILLLVLNSIVSIQLYKRWRKKRVIKNLLEEIRRTDAGGVEEELHLEKNSLPVFKNAPPPPPQKIVQEWRPDDMAIVIDQKKKPSAKKSVKKTKAISKTKIKKHATKSTATTAVRTRTK